jgi:hypothetical protein
LRLDHDDIFAGLPASAPGPRKMKFEQPACGQTADEKIEFFVDGLARSGQRRKWQAGREFAGARSRCRTEPSQGERHAVESRDHVAGRARFDRDMTV